MPLCFGYTVKDKAHITLFFHSAGEGHKLDLLRKDNHVAFEMDTAHDLFSRGSDACGYGMRYQCVMGTGTARLVTEDSEKAVAFDHIMAHYTQEKLPYSSTALHAAIIIAVDVLSISCKVHQ